MKLRLRSGDSGTRSLALPEDAKMFPPTLKQATRVIWRSYQKPNLEKSDRDVRKRAMWVQASR